MKIKFPPSVLSLYHPNIFPPRRAPPRHLDRVCFIHSCYTPYPTEEGHVPSVEKLRERG